MGSPGWFRRIEGVVDEERTLFRVRGRLLLLTPALALLPNGTLVRLRTMLYRVGGVQIGRGSVVMGTLRLWGTDRLSMGERSTINTPCAICLDGAVTIGNGVLIGHDVIITTGAHSIGPATARGGPVVPRPVCIEDGVWIGAGAMILPGVTVGAGSVIAAGAVVTKDVPPNSLAMGVPARVTRVLDAEAASSSGLNQVADERR